MLEQKIPSKSFDYIVFITRPHKWWALGAIGVVVIAATLDQSTSYIFKLVIDAVEAGETQTALLWGLLFPVAIFLIQSMFRISGYFGMQWAIKTRKDGFDTLFNHVTNHGHEYFSDHFAGSVHNKIRNVVDGVDSLIPEILWTFINSFVAMVVTFFFILFVDVLSAGIFLGLIATLLVANYFMAPKKQLLSKKNAEASSVLHAHMIDILSNISATRQYARKMFEKRRIAKLTEVHHDTNKASWIYTEIMLFINGTILFIFGFTMFYILVSRWNDGDITTGQFVLVASLIGQLSGTLIFIGRAFNSTARTIGEVKEGFEELLVPFDIIDSKDAKPLNLSEATISWKNVTFTYGENRVFDEFDLVIPSGQRVGLVGPSGAGKTTFVSLLLRQHDLSNGEILIDGQNIAEVTQDSLRENIAVVPQEPLLFHRSIRENIAYGKPDATDNEIMAVARLAKAHEFIRDLAEGYDTLVGERGIKLSGGQKQRVAIARAMLKDAPILVLDEATSALDSESEVAIQQALHKLMEGKTVIAIAHRLSTLREMDRIIVLEGGKIVEDGSHDSLLQYDGVYSRLWKHQAGGFLQE
ncbi:ABC transporter permease [Candidatus Kaiserbacteria bacterium CG10_big_fil_rev_8_21_14_0_10_44_10]|uniref:ABC transporter permease n=1 Tax=Candidatus Kaiserbacteria bacterium CG10_big_fil_rev_8_21_14_0_10_44_10 TaxID=1974606 RepID=A0A2H0UHL4_9BACT|nr:MAG: ABC transporter permease [Candidatus Kaiserbacteria bacterium CG10_big_fil_rev_8_21_14_0_10_44_10]